MGYADPRRLFLVVIVLGPHAPNRSGFRLVLVERLGCAGDVGAGWGFLSVGLSFLLVGARSRCSPLSMGDCVPPSPDPELGGVGIGFRNLLFLHKVDPESSLTRYERFLFFSRMVPVEVHFLVTWS